MNIRMAEDEVRFRITRSEAAGLLQGHSSECHLTLSTTLSWHFYLHPVLASQKVLQLEVSHEQVVVYVQQDALQQLVKQMPTRESLTESIQVGNDALQSVRVILEIDIRKKSPSDQLQ